MSHFYKTEVEEKFAHLIFPRIKKEHEKDGQRNAPARFRAWQEYKQYLYNMGEIRGRQYRNWVTPKWL